MLWAWWGSGSDSRAATLLHPCYMSKSNSSAVLSLLYNTCSSSCILTSLFLRCSFSESLNTFLKAVVENNLFTFHNIGLYNISLDFIPNCLSTFLCSFEQLVLFFFSLLSAIIVPWYLNTSTCSSCSPCQWVDFLLVIWLPQLLIYLRPYWTCFPYSLAAQKFSPVGLLHFLPSLPDHQLAADFMTLYFMPLSLLMLAFCILIFEKSKINISIIFHLIFLQLLHPLFLYFSKIQPVNCWWL